ncbi:MAG: hypothetical protein JJ934_07870 [Pseudomonadales bacterium]|nr:hypothetical protein [Pseudomonadales bacterium]
MQVNLPALLVLFCSVTVWFQNAQAETGFDGWYQVDVILFKPRNTSLDEESWPTRTPEYPADILSVYPGEPFNLSQLEQALDTDAERPHAEEMPSFSDNAFAFESQSNRNRNRRVVEAMTGMGDQAASHSGAETTLKIAPNAGDGAVAEPPQTKADKDDIRDLVSNTPGTTDGQLAFSSVEDSSLDMIRRSLSRSSRFDVVDHQSWIQPIHSEPTSVMVQTGQRYDDRFEIEGTISISRSRFLHVQTDLWYTIFEPRGGSENPFLQGFESSLTDEQLKDYQDLVDVERERGQYFAARSHVMSQSRRLRSDELHYIDHPLFGVLVRINRYQPDVSSTGD